MTFETGAVREAVDLVLGSGEIAVIEGASGSGKGTLLRALALLEPSRGALRVDGVDSSAMTPAAYRSSVAYVPQTAVMHAVRYQLVILYQLVIVAAVSGLTASHLARRMLFTEQAQLRRVGAPKH